MTITVHYLIAKYLIHAKQNRTLPKEDKPQIPFKFKTELKD